LTENENSYRWLIYENNLVYDKIKTKRPKLDKLYESKFLNKLLLSNSLKKNLVKNKELKFQDLIEFKNGAYIGQTKIDSGTQEIVPEGFG
jgi:hypothetical protein